jgi:hypothetical protein
VHATGSRKQQLAASSSAILGRPIVVLKHQLKHLCDFSSIPRRRASTASRLIEESAAKVIEKGARVRPSLSVHCALRQFAAFLALSLHRCAAVTTA